MLVIRRNDGRGLCFPGGLALPWESDHETLVREIREETGLISQRVELAFRYESHADVPARIAVFEVEASGELRGSWEGTPGWMNVHDLPHAILPSQKYIVEKLLAGTCESQDPA